MPKAAAKKPPRRGARTHLSIRQQRFARFYVETGGNGLEACKRAGYNGNENTLCVQASRLIRLPKVAQRIDLFERGLVSIADNVVLDCLTDPDVPREIRLRAADLAYKRHGAYAPERHEVARVPDALSDEQRERFLRIARMVDDRPPLPSPAPPTAALGPGHAPEEGLAAPGQFVEEGAPAANVGAPPGLSAPSCARAGDDGGG